MKRSVWYRCTLLFWIIGTTGCTGVLESLVSVGRGLAPNFSTQPGSEKSPLSFEQISRLGGIPSTVTPQFLGNLMIFPANDGVHGQELWVANPGLTEFTLLKDIAEGPRSSFPHSLVQVGSLVFFFVKGLDQFELWRTDGTESGTFKLGQYQVLANAVQFQGSLLFIGQTADYGSEAWISDGTVGGTARISDIDPGAGDGVSFFYGKFVVLGGRAYFTAISPVHGEELWSTDGTLGGTRLEADIIPGTDSSSPGQSGGGFAATSTHIIFNARTTANGDEPFSIDASGTLTPLGDLYPFGASSNPQGMVVLDDKAYFLARVPGPFAFTYRVFESNGTPAGTTVLSPSVSVSDRSWAIQHAGQFLFVFGSDSTHSDTVFAIDRTDGTTTPFVPAVPSGISARGPVVQLGNEILLKISTASEGNELWKFNTTTRSWSQVKDLYAGSSSGAIQILGSKNGKVLFSGDDGSTGSELWMSDGTPAGTQLLSDASPGANHTYLLSLFEFPPGHPQSSKVLIPASTSLGQSPYLLTNGTAIGTQFLSESLTATDGIDFGADLLNASRSLIDRLSDQMIFKIMTYNSGVEFWSLDVNSNFELIQDTRVTQPELSASSSHLFRIFKSNEMLFFNVNLPSIGESLFQTGGTSANTSLIRSGTFSFLGETDSRILLTLTEPGLGREIWSMSTVGDDLQMTNEIVAGAGSAIVQAAPGLRLDDGYVYFAAGPSGDVELWRTNGLNGGTTIVKDIDVGAGSSMTVLQGAKFGTTLIFAATDGAVGSELWKTEGTEASTVLVKDIRIGASGSSPSQFSPVSAGVIFTADDGVHGKELWFSDGTDGGTRMLPETAPGTYFSDISTLAQIPDPDKLKYLFFATSDEFGREPFVTDGTTEGTFRLADLNPGAGSSFVDLPNSHSTRGRYIYFFAQTANGKIDLFRTDGTPDGTTTVLERPLWTSFHSAASPFFFESALYIMGSLGSASREVFKINGLELTD